MFRVLLEVLRRPERLATRARRLGRYARKFGLIHGGRVLYKLLASNGPLIRFEVRQSKTALVARPGTSDVPTFEQIFVYDDYVLPFKLEPKLIVDGGANVGYASVFFANTYPAAEIIAVEPEGSNFEMLLKNTAAYRNITAIQAGIWHRAASLEVENPTDEKWDFRVRESETEERGIRSITILDILALAKAEQIDILKLDIEGAERELFSSGYAGWLGRVRVLIVELHDKHKPGCSESFYSATSQYPFKAFQQGENVMLVKEEIVGDRVVLA